MVLRPEKIEAPQVEPPGVPFTGPTNPDGDSSE